LPYRGARTLLNYENNSVLNDYPTKTSSNFGILSGDSEYYLSSRNKHPFTLGLRIGGATTHREVPWYKLPILGTAKGLRGYVDERFAGDATAYFNTELRYQLFEKNTSIVPVKVGVKAFFDYGRVFQSGIDESDDWRSGYGFGFYVVPFDESITFTISLGFSEEESFYPVFSVGTPLR
jgi:hemolysin activation/secretion protein